MEAPNFLQFLADMLHVPNFMVFTWFIMLVILYHQHLAGIQQLHWLFWYLSITSI